MTLLTPLETYLEDAYQFSYADECIDVHVERMHEDSKEGLRAEVTVYLDTLEGDPQLLHQARITLPSSQSRSIFIKQLERRATEEPLVKTDFQGIIEQVSFRTQKRWREGEPLVTLADVNYWDRPTYLVRPLILANSPTVLFGRGGLGKSIMALAMGLSVATGQPIFGQRPQLTGTVLYYDWEWDQETHAARLAALCKWLNISMPRNIHYRHMVASLPTSAARIRQEIAKHKAVLVIIDSMGLARGGEVKDDGATNAVFAAVRTFGCATFLLDHVTKNATNQEGPIGSVYTLNGARLMWRLDGVRLDGTSKSVLSLVNTKANGKYQPARGFELDVEADDDDRPVFISITSRDLRHVPELRAKLGRQAQLESVLLEAGKSLTVEEIREALLESDITMSIGAIRVELNRAKDMFVSIKPTDGTKTVRWGLASKDES